jgi:hypothetical protein
MGTFYLSQQKTPDQPSVRKFNLFIKARRTPGVFAQRSEANRHSEARQIMQKKTPVSRSQPGFSINPPTIADHNLVCSLGETNPREFALRFKSSEQFSRGRQ